MTDVAPLTPVDALSTRGMAFALFARLFDADPAALLDGEALDQLAACLVLLGETRALDKLDALADVPARDAEELRRHWTRWFDQGRVAPYECSNRAATVAGHTVPLADIAGFYRALGMRVSGERPDHVVAELEFASLVTLAEAQARREGREDDASVCADMARSFLRDHLGVWLDAWAVRVLAIEPPLPWGPIAAAAAAFTAAEAARRNVLPVRTDAVFDADRLALADESELPRCGDGDEA